MNSFQKVLYKQADKIQNSNLPIHVKKVVSAVSLCRTNAMKGRVYSCPRGHFSVFMRESCNNRSCPTCQSEKKKEWNTITKQKVNQAPHFHLVFKLPSFTYPFILTYYQEFIEILFRASANTIQKIIKFSFDLAPTPAFISVLHTHGNQYQLHPHIHLILDSVCLSKKKDKIFFLDDSLFQFDNFLSVYNHFLRKELVTLFNKPDIKDEIKRLINDFSSETLFISKKYDSPFPIIDYLTKTIKGNALNLNSVNFLDNGSIELSKNEKKYIFSNDEYINRFIKHIIPQNVKSIRYSGFYSSASKKDYQIVKELLQQEKLNSLEDEHLNEVEDSLFASHLIHKICPFCKDKMILTEEVDQYTVPNIIYIKFGKDPPTEDLFRKLAA